MSMRAFEIPEAPVNTIVGGLLSGDVALAECETVVGTEVCRVTSIPSCVLA